MMKKILLITGFLTTVFLTILMTGCDQRQASGLKDYTVTCTLDNELRHDSATLLVLEDEYNKLRVCGASRAQDHVFTFKGQIERPKVALIGWDNDSTNPFYFVLEAGHINVRIDKGSWRVNGSRENLDYQHFIHQRNDIMNARVAIWQDYLKAADNASLKQEEELRMVRQDSLLNDSLQRITVERINRGDAVGRIIRERFADKLDKEHARQLK